jgi:hypothetical protein
MQYQFNRPVREILGWFDGRVIGIEAITEDKIPGFAKEFFEFLSDLNNGRLNYHG